MELPSGHYYHFSLPKNRASIARLGLQRNNYGEVNLTEHPEYAGSSYDLWLVDARGLKLETKDVEENQIVARRAIRPTRLRFLRPGDGQHMSEVGN